jgi:general stress protein 26
MNSATERHDFSLEASPSDRSQLHALLSEFDTVMLGTFEANGITRVNARPMAVAHLEPDCRLRFFTARDNALVAGSPWNRAAQVFGQSRLRYVSILGRIEMSEDRGLIKQFWKPSFQPWFDGPEDSKLVLVTFMPDEAELWDSTGAKGIKYLFRTAKAAITGEQPPEPARDQHKKMKL